MLTKNLYKTKMKGSIEMKSWSKRKLAIFAVFAVFILYTQLEKSLQKDYMFVDFGKEHYEAVVNTPQSEGVALDYSIKRVYHQMEPYELTVYCNLPTSTKLRITIVANNHDGTIYAFDENSVSSNGQVTVPFGYKILSSATYFELQIKYAYIAMPPEVVNGHLANHQPQETRLLLGENGEKIQIANISADKVYIQHSKENEGPEQYYFTLKERISLPKKK